MCRAWVIAFWDGRQTFGRVPPLTDQWFPPVLTGMGAAGDGCPCRIRDRRLCPSPSPLIEMR